MTEIGAINLGPLTAACGPDCPAFVAKWSDWWASKTSEPVALLDCRGGIDAYMERLGPKGRNMVRKANQLYQFGEFPFNFHVRGIERVNRSKVERQGIPMQGWYTQPVEPTTQPKLCGLHSDLWIGGFRRDDWELMGYVRVEVLNELAIINSILGHADAPAVVNGLMAYMVEFLGARWINYLGPRGRTQGLTDFKRRIGFEAVTVTSGDGVTIARPELAARGGA